MTVRITLSLDSHLATKFEERVSKIGMKPQAAIRNLMILFVNRRLNLKVSKGSRGRKGIRESTHS